MAVITKVPMEIAGSIRFAASPTAKCPTGISHFLLYDVLRRVV